MIRSVQSSSGTDATQQAAKTSAVEPATSAAKNFADVHKQALAKIDAPDGETWAPVEGDAHYARIISGPRSGQYINLTRGDRRGQTFTIEKQGGKTMHVYGSGDSATSVDASADDQQVKPHSKNFEARVAADQPPKNETWAPVAGHSSYADILNGKRNGLYVNITGGVRDGMAFQLVKQGDRTYHIYGSGKNRQVIEVGASRTKPASSK